jgi:hypothetical protein
MAQRADVLNRRPAETITFGAGAVAAAISAIVGVDATAAAIVVGALGTIPGIVSAVVSTSRKVTQGLALVGLTDDVAASARDVLQKARAAGDWKAEADALKSVAVAVSAWSELLASQPAGGEKEQTT